MSDQPRTAAAQNRRDAQAAAFAATAAVVTLLALDHGAYDIVVRQKFAIVLWWVLGLAVVTGLLPRTRPSRAGLVVLGALALMAVWTAISLAWTSSDERTVTEIARVVAHLGVVLLVATALGPATWRAGVAGATAAAVAVCVVALGSRLSPDIFGGNPTADTFGAARLSAPLGYWNAVGSWAVMTVALCLGWSAHAAGRLWRAGALAAVPLAITVAYMTYSRAALADAVVAALLLFALSRHRWTLVVNGLAAGAGAGAIVLVARHAHSIINGTGTSGAFGVLLITLAACAAAGATALATHGRGMDDWRLSPPTARKALIAVSVIAIAGLAVASATVLPDSWHSFKQYHGAKSTDPAAHLTTLSGDRYQLYKVDLESFADHPFSGTGAGTFEFSWNMRGKLSEFVRDGHSLFLESLSELGILGFALVLALVGAAIVVLRKALGQADDTVDRGALAGAAAALGGYLTAASVDWQWESTAVTILALVLLGCAMAAVGSAQAPLRPALRGGVVVAAIIAGAVQLPGLVSTVDIRKSQAASDGGDVATALARADQAIDAEPWSATALVQRALVEERVNALGAARSDLIAAARREPDNWRFPLILARVEARLGNGPAALASYRLARKLRPNGAFFQLR